MKIEDNSNFFKIGCSYIFDGKTFICEEEAQKLFLTSLPFRIAVKRIPITDDVPKKLGLTFDEVTQSWYFKLSNFATSNFRLYKDKFGKWGFSVFSTRKRISISCEVEFVDQIQTMFSFINVHLHLGDEIISNEFKKNK